MTTLEERVQQAVGEDVAITPYDPSWPELFQREAAHLRACIPAGLTRRRAFQEHWERLLFRDHLIAHPQTAREYERLKTKLAAAHPNDRVAYTNGKTAFIQRVTTEAKQMQ